MTPLASELLELCLILACQTFVKCPDLTVLHTSIPWLHSYKEENGWKIPTRCDKEISDKGKMNIVFFQ